MVATAVLPSDRRECALDDMILPVRLLTVLSLSTMSVIAVFAFLAAARRGREAIRAGWRNDKPKGAMGCERRELGLWMVGTLAAPVGGGVMEVCAARPRLLGG